MKVTKNTKISKILRENKNAVDTIASINKHFKKLNNPVLRRVLAPRVTVKDAAKIGHISINEFLKRLKDIGFEVIYDDEIVTDSPINQNKAFIDISKLIELDVRPIMEAGADPFSVIMSALKEIKKGETLKLINIFEPIPIIQILEEKGYKSQTEKICDKEYHIYFTKNTTTTHKDIVTQTPITEGSFEEVLLNFGSNLKEIDVRLLEMPEPMVNILKSIETLPEDHVLLVNHKKVPQFLLPELKSRNYTWIHKDIEPGLTQLLIYKQ